MTATLLRDKRSFLTEAVSDMTVAATKFVCHAGSGNRAFASASDFADGVLSKRSTARSATAMVGALVLPLGISGNIEQSMTRKLFIPCTRNERSTTDVSGSCPMRQLPTGW